jgi:hypothetical protein
MVKVRRDDLAQIREAVQFYRKSILFGHLFTQGFILKS